MKNLRTRAKSPLLTPTKPEIHLQGSLFDLAAQANRPLIFNTVLCNHGNDHDFRTELLGCFPNFTTHLFVDVYGSSTWGRGTVILLNTTDKRAVAFLANYPQVQEASRSQSEPKDDITPAQVNFLPILCWCSSIEQPVAGSQQGTKRIAVVVTFSFHECVPKKMGEFWSIERRQDRVAKFEQWAFLDLAVDQCAARARPAAGFYLLQRECRR
ncbi:hypothetical protein FANTH_2357 [Fusarium anthophilum]|uniref:Uncharacterized protein n=1 Tax=Fusarium anthophilum TaxID=48485 RepID=A0A8H5EAD4_9HYPO|nr:hypothetical protein FANTH_2357 [Fusarium anthophilum]